MGISNFTVDDGDILTNGLPGAGIMIPQLPDDSDVENIADFLTNYNDKFIDNSPALFRDEVIKQTLAVLIRKDKPNPMLVGPAGVGKTRIVEEIARLIANDDPIIPERLENNLVYELSLSSLVAGAGVVGELEKRIVQIVDFASDPDNKIILFIDEIHMLGNSRDPSYAKLSEFLKPALARGQMHLIGATTNLEGRQIENDPAFSRRFTRVIVDELTQKQTVQVLMDLAPRLEKHHGGRITLPDEVLVLAAKTADEFASTNQHRPDSAITLLDSAAADMVVSHQAAIAEAENTGYTGLAQTLKNVKTLSLSEHRLRSMSLRLVSGVAKPYDADLDVLEHELRDRILGQKPVLVKLLEFLRRDALGVFPRHRPLVWLSTGPSGVGKTETAKLVSRRVTGQAPIVLNMNEYAHAHDISKIIGSGPGYVGSDSNRELLFDTLESNPYRLILLDELEKADRAVHRLLLTVLDEGWLRTASGKVMDFSKTIIMATTNAGQDILNKPRSGFKNNTNTEPISEQNLHNLLKNSFDIEFLARFDQVFVYQPISMETYKEIIRTKYVFEKARIVDEKPRIGSKLPVLDEDTLTRLAEDNFLSNQGARSANRAVKRFIEDTLLKQQSSTATAQTVSPDSNTASTIVVQK